MTRLLFSVLTVGTAFGLAACGSSAPLVGRTTPDETRVIDGPRLTLPPEFSLRPPVSQQNYAETVSQNMQAEARTLITGETETTAMAPAAGPAGAKWLLNQAGSADPAIRQTLEAESAAAQAAAEQEEKGLLDRWFGRK